jgi:hypothetical protein
MRRSRLLLVCVSCMLLAFLIGCSSRTVPVTPGDVDTFDGVPVIGLAGADGTYNATGILGVYELTIDPNKMTVDLVTKRSEAIGEDYIVSGIGFFTAIPCPDCLRLTGFSLDPRGALALNFWIKHPFPVGNSSLPPSASNRNDLSVFDLAMVIAPSEVIPSTYPLTGVDVQKSTCMFADGYTTELANVGQDQSALPYFLVIDDTDEDPITSTWNKFAQGAESFFDVFFAPPTGLISYDMYLTMGYGASAKKPGRLTPKYYNPEFNRKAAWKVAVTPPQGDNPPAIGNTWQDNDATTLYNVTVTVYDWQCGAAVWDGVTPASFADAGANMVWAASEIESVSAEVPGMTIALASSATPASGTGTLADPYVYTVALANENLLPVGVYTGLVKVSDARSPLTPTDGRDFLIDSPDGIALNNYTMPEYATYQTFPATVVLGCGPISGQIDSPVCPVTGLTTGSIVPFAISASSANGGDPITLYEMDMDYDGTFVADDSNATGLFNAGPFTPPAPCDDNIPYSWTVAFRATDSCDPPNVALIATCEVTVSICCSDQELSYDWTGCTSGMTCQGWQAGACSLPNTSQYGYGSFSWNCQQAASYCSSGLVSPYMTSDWNPNYSFCSGFHYYSSDMNVVSPVLNLPPSADGLFEFDWCMLRCSDCTFRLYISTAGCSGPWTELWNSTTDGCHVGEASVDISSYSGSNIMFRFRYSGTQYQFNYGTCDAPGVKLDNVSINGCFAGDLTD